MEINFGVDLVPVLSSSHVSVELLDWSPPVPVEQSRVLHKARSLRRLPVAYRAALPEAWVSASENSGSLLFLVDKSSTVSSFPSLVAEVRVGHWDSGFSVEPRNGVVLVFQSSANSSNGPAHN